MSNPPKKIHFLSDKTTAELILKPVMLKSKEELFWYRYTVAAVLKGRETILSLKQIEYLIKMNLLIVME